MKAIRYYGKDLGFRLEDVEEPLVSNDYDVVVKVEAAGLCRTDLHILNGEFEQLIRKKPFILGHENAGVVKDAGTRVSNLRKGDLVLVYPQITCGLCLPCRRGDEMRCNNGRFHGLDGTDGGFAEYLITSHRSVIPVRRHGNLANYAVLADAGITAYHAVKRISPLVPKVANVLVIGAGGVGQLAIQLLNLSGFYNTIVLEKSEQKIELVKKLGVKAAIKYEDEEVISKIKSLAPEGVNVVLDFVGSSSTALLSLGLLKPSGIYSVVGYGGELRVPTMELVAKEITILGNLVGTYSELFELVEIYEKFGISVPVKTFSIEQFGEAVEQLKDGTIIGRAVIKP